MESSEIMEYAPVTIPTLCRYNHFRNCLESLMKCTHADKTDVYIGLDYPAKEEHWKGYRQICDYLESIKNNHGFKHLTVIKRDRNYGVGVNGNADVLRDYVFSKYDTLITTEDDNIFSAGFLDYINKGLIKFKDDKSVLAINGYSHYYPKKNEANTFYRQNVDFSAWGWGAWKDKYKAAFSVDKSYFKRKCTFSNLYKIYRRCGLNRVMELLGNAYANNSQLRITDSLLSVYMELEAMNVVMPLTSLVRNMGFDGSGEHCKEADVAALHNDQEISTNPYFEYIGTGYEFYRDNQESHRKNSYGRISFGKFIGIIFSKVMKKIRK